MTDLLKPAKRPCGSCPYRKDVPAGIWAAEEYAKLPAYDGPTYAQAHQLFMCHQQDGCLCGGWLGTHGVEELLAIRFGVARGEVDPVVFDFEPGVELFASGFEAAWHGMSGIENPSPEAQRKIDGLMRVRGMIL